MYWRHRFPRYLPLLLALVVVLSGLTVVDAEQRYVRLTILHTNDTHSHLLPFSYPTEVVIEGKRIELPYHNDVGGIARRATVIKRMKCSAEPVLVLDAGDITDGSPFSIEFAGEADFATIAAAGYDAMVTGNHEYNISFANLNKYIMDAPFPVVCANVFRAGDGTRFLPPYIIRTEDGLRVAILGLVAPNTYTAVKEGKLEIKDPIQIAREWVPKLRAQADAVILLTHIGFEEDEKLAEQVPGIDAIIGGHSHTRLDKPILVKRDPMPGAFSVGGTVVAQDFQWGGDIGELDLVFRKGDIGWTLMSFSGKLIPITSDIPEDPEVREVVEKYHRQIASKYDVVLGRATADFIGEAPINMVSDALRETYNADFAIHNYGGVRTDLVRGEITAGDIAMLFPFGNSTMTFEMTGAQLKEILRTTLPAVSNIKYKVQGGKLVSAELGGKPIEDARVYKGVTHSFFASSSMPGITTNDVGVPVRDVVVKYIQGKKAITPDNERRATTN